MESPDRPYYYCRGCRKRTTRKSRICHNCKLDFCSICLNKTQKRGDICNNCWCKKTNYSVPDIPNTSNDNKNRKNNKNNKIEDNTDSTKNKTNSDNDTSSPIKSPITLFIIAKNDDIIEDETNGNRTEDESNDNTKNKNDKPKKKRTKLSPSKRKDASTSIQDLITNDPFFRNLVTNGFIPEEMINKSIRQEQEKKHHEEKQKQLEEPEEDMSKYPYEWLGNINSLDDLIKLGESYNSRKRKRHNINLKQLNKLVEPLQELKNMIGLETVKQTIFEQIIYYLQELDDKNNDMLHTVIEGPPGVGKTQISFIIAKIYKALGFLTSDKVVSVKRDDLIAGYLGQTAIKTRKKIDEAVGGVLLIDEAYSLGDASGKDSYSKEAIDILTAYLSEHPHDLVCIVAGYKDALKQRFFSQNEGLERRFTHRFEINKYSPSDLRLIFFKVVRENNWSILKEKDISVGFFEKNIDYFKFNGGDMLTLFAYCKKAHARRILDIKDEGNLKYAKKKLNDIDMEEGMKLFLKNPEHAERKQENSMPTHLYI